MAKPYLAWLKNYLEPDMLIDIFLLLVIGFGIYHGFVRGFILTIFSGIAWIIGLFAALKLTAVFSEWLRDAFDSTSPYIPLISFFLLFAGVVALVILFARVIDKIISVAQLGIFNKIAGALFKGLLFLLFASVALWLVNQAGFIKPETKADSKLYSWVEPIAPSFFKFIDHNIPALKGLLTDLKKYFNQFDLPELFK
ncbi:MAG: CvpA family protein [Bacteroidota bacterium]|jgi:membrane protein required for colicin V production